MDPLVIHRTSNHIHNIIIMQIYIHSYMQGIAIATSYTAPYTVESFVAAINAHVYSYAQLATVACFNAELDT